MDSKSHRMTWLPGQSAGDAAPAPVAAPVSSMCHLGLSCASLDVSKRVVLLEMLSGKCCVLCYPLGSEPCLLDTCELARRHAHIPSRGSRPQNCLQNPVSSVGREKCPRNRTPSAPLCPHSTQGKAGLSEKGTKRPENPEDSSCYSYPRSLGTL